MTPCTYKDIRLVQPAYSISTVDSKGYPLEYEETQKEMDVPHFYLCNSCGDTREDWEAVVKHIKEQD